MKVNRTVRLVGAIALFCGCVFGQSTAGILQGTVIDPAGAAIPDATAVIKDPATGITHTGVSGGDGTFILNGVEPGTYNLTVTAKSGFKVFGLNAISVSPNERRDLGKIALQIGSQTEEVWSPPSLLPYRRLPARTPS